MVPLPLYSTDKGQKCRIFHQRHEARPHSSGNYTVELTGILTSELALSLIGRTRIRAYGFLNFNDSVNNTGKITVDRNNKINIEINNRKVET